MADVEIIVLVAVGTVALLITFLRGPRPDPELAAEPVWVILRDVAIAFAYVVGATLLLGLLPDGLRVPAVVVVAGATLATITWRTRRHPGTSARRAVAVGSAPPAAVDEAATTTGDWARALLFIAVIVALVIVVFMAGIGAFCGCTTRPGL